MSNLLNLLRNKYFLITTAFVIWMLFFDRNDLMLQYEYRTELNKKEKEKEFYLRETRQVKKDLDELTTNRERLEKFAREKYLMKKENEDVYLIITKPEVKKKSFF